MINLHRTIRADLKQCWPNVGWLRIIWLYLTEPGVNATVRLRLQQFLHDRGYRAVARVIRRRNFTINGIDIVPGAEIGPGLTLRHPSGIVIGHRVIIGERATILQNVTIGQRNVSAGSDAANPIIGDDVTLAAGAVVIGSVTIGHGAVVGANSVVTRNVDAGTAVAGVPAKPMTALRTK